MRNIIVITLAVVLLLLSGCDSTPAPTAPAITPGTQIEREAGVDTTHEREWMAAWFAEFYAERFGNSKFGNQYMVCYLLYTAPFNHGQSTGSLEFFLSDYFDDFLILLLVDMIEYKYGAEYAYPFDWPQCF